MPYNRNYRRIPFNIAMFSSPIKFLAAALGIVVLAATSAAAFDFSGWDRFLKQYIRTVTIAGIRLNALPYPTLKGDPEFARIVAGLEAFSPDTLRTREEKLAFWINTYNILAVKVVLDHYPVDSIKDAGGFFQSVWKLKAGKVGGRDVTLHEIEHEILRKMDEPRIHVAIVCASVSCPDLRAEAYTAKRLDDQLSDQLRRFLQNPGKGMRLDREKRIVYLSSIFKWFEEDFESRGGVLKFLANYVPEEDRALMTSGQLKVSYLDYNWDLNAV